MWLLSLSSRTVFSCFCTLRLASSPRMFPSLISISYSRMLRVSRSSTIEICFMWIPRNWSALNPSIHWWVSWLGLKFLLPVVECHSKGRLSARKRHKLSLNGCLVFSSYVRQLIVWFLSRRSGKTAFLHPIGTSLSTAANTVKFVNLWNLQFVFILSPLQDSMTSVLLKRSFSFAKSSLMHTSLDRSSRVLFSCA